jgi:hypothetical protein
MTNSRIFFNANPWPEGHPIKSFEWTARVENGEIWFDFHLKSENYYSERDAEDIETEEKQDWDAPNVWGNYHSCILSTNYWHNGGFRVGAVGAISLDSIDGLELVFDSPPPEDKEENAFHIYLLGHDAVADHRIKFTRVAGTDCFNIDWVGKIALVYIGEDEYKHGFVVSLRNVAAPSLPNACPTLER